MHKKVTRTRRVYRKRKPTVKSLAKTVKRIQNDVELKFFDFAVQGIPPTVYLSDGGAGSFITQGVTQNNRIGDSVDITSMQLRYNINGNPSGGICVWRVLVVQDTQPNFTPVWVPAATASSQSTNDFWEYNPTFSSFTSYLNYPDLFQYNRDTIHTRYKVWYDKVHTINASAGVSGTYVPMVKSYKVHLKHRIKQQYVEVSTGQNLTKNRLWVISFCSVTGAQITWTSRLFYKDP